MKTIYTLNTRLMNGSVTMMVHSDSFTSEELAEKARRAVQEANKGANIICEISKSILFESEEEVPILQQK